ncbi:hypothetical protein Barb4_03239 [Bacteroidales bacterium Barb4]|nr:hypothetical protein Barb4_03239 [Bacteroidales bacterium Barb4]
MCQLLSRLLPLVVAVSFFSADMAEKNEGVQGGTPATLPTSFSFWYNVLHHFDMGVFLCYNNPCMIGIIITQKNTAVEVSSFVSTLTQTRTPPQRQSDKGV